MYYGKKRTYDISNKCWSPKSLLDSSPCYDFDVLQVGPHDEKFHTEIQNICPIVDCSICAKYKFNTARQRYERFVGTTTVQCTTDRSEYFPCCGNCESPTKIIEEFERNPIIIVNQCEEILLCRLPDRNSLNISMKSKRIPKYGFMHYANDFCRFKSQFLDGEKRECTCDGAGNKKRLEKQDDETKSAPTNIKMDKKPIIPFISFLGSNKPTIDYPPRITIDSKDDLFKKTYISFDATLKFDDAEIYKGPPIHIHTHHQLYVEPLPKHDLPSPTSTQTPSVDIISHQMLSTSSKQRTDEQLFTVDKLRTDSNEDFTDMEEMETLGIDGAYPEMDMTDSKYTLSLNGRRPRKTPKIKSSCEICKTKEICPCIKQKRERMIHDMWSKFWHRDTKSEEFSTLESYNAPPIRSTLVKLLPSKPKIQLDTPHDEHTLTPEEISRIRKVLRAPLKKVIAIYDTTELYRNDMETLEENNLLNDNIINSYLYLLMIRSRDNLKLPKIYCFDTYFYPKLVEYGHSGVDQWTSNVNIFIYSFIFIPVRIEKHHRALVVINMRQKIIFLYDSSKRKNQKPIERILRYMHKESLAKRKKHLTCSDWKQRLVPNNPKHVNGLDCGVFLCLNAEFISRNLFPDYKPEDITYYRYRIMSEIISGELIN